MVQDGDGGAGGAGGNDKKLPYMRYLVSTFGAPFQPQSMPSMQIKIAEGFMDESKCFHTFFITHVAKRVTQVPIAIKRYNQTAVEKMSLAVNGNGSNCIVIFPGKTSYKDNRLYGKISEAATVKNSTYWTWKSPIDAPGSEAEMVGITVRIDDKQVIEELEDELAMVTVENKRVREKLEVELAKVKDGEKKACDELVKVKDNNKRARDELEAELAAVKTENTRACEENQRLRGELEESQNLHGGLKQMRFCCG